MPHRGKPAKKDKASFGKAIIRRHEQDRRNAALNPKLPTAERLKSQLDSTSLEEFVNAAILSDRDFTARKEREDVILLSSDGLTQIGGKPRKRQNDYNFDFEQLTVPRRPKWRRDMTAQELDKLEKQSFIDWRRSLAMMEENDPDGRKVTPYEKNIEVWRQLWRVMERSDMIIQIVDARNPTFYFSKDLTKYAVELNPPKPMIILVNKSDFLTDKQRQIWGEFFMRQGWSFVFYSAHKEQTKLNEDARTLRDRGASSVEPLTIDDELVEFLVERFVGQHFEKVEREKANKPVKAPRAKPEEQQRKEAEEDEDDVDENEDGEEEDDEGDDEDEEEGDEEDQEEEDAEEEDAEGEEEEESHSQHAAEQTQPTPPAAELTKEERTRQRALGARLTNRLELLRLLERLGQALHIEPNPKNSDRLCVGMVGYPNVGKSSVINTLLGVTPLDHKSVRVRVGATPGKTKHFQTLPLSETVMLCDCPGLVFPSFVSSTADMICAGVLPINQMRDHVGPVTLICQRVPPQLLEATYNIRLPPQRDPTVKIGARDFLHAYCRARVYYAQGSGQPDEVRASREILSDYVNGRLLHSHAPPGLMGDGLQLFQRETLRASAQSEKVRARLLAAQKNLLGEDDTEEQPMPGHEEEYDENAADAHAEAEEDADGGDEDLEEDDLEAELGPEGVGESDGDDDDDDDDDIDNQSSTQDNTQSGRPHTRQKRWGRKGKKLRNKTPYEATDEFGAPVTYGARTKDKRAVNKQNGQVFVRK